MQDVFECVPVLAGRLVAEHRALAIRLSLNGTRRLVAAFAPTMVKSALDSSGVDARLHSWIYLRL
jgi:hypothetical protein